MEMTKARGWGTLLIDYIRLYIGGCPPELGKLQLAASYKNVEKVTSMEVWTNMAVLTHIKVLTSVKVLTGIEALTSMIVYSPKKSNA